MKLDSEIVWHDPIKGEDVAFELYTEKKKDRTLILWYIKDTRTKKFVNKNKGCIKKPTVAEILAICQ